MQGFLNFIREQGVVGLAVGFILGGAVSQLVGSLVADIINPLIGVVLANADVLSEATVTIGTATLKWGNFATLFIDFVVIALVVYAGVKILKVDRLDKKKA